MRETVARFIRGVGRYLVDLADLIDVDDPHPAFESNTEIDRRIP